jgi:hypothetical protein
MLEPMSIGGLRLIIVPEPKPPHWSKPRCPTSVPPGRRRAWKRSNPPRFLRPTVYLEHGKMLRTSDTVFMRAADYWALQQRLSRP